MSQMLIRLKNYKANPAQQIQKKNFFEFETDKDSGKHKLFGFEVPKSFMKF